MSVHEFNKRCSTCGSTSVRRCEDTLAVWCFKCDDWAGGELDRIAKLNGYEPHRPLTNGKDKNTHTGESYEPFSRHLEASERPLGSNKI